jgi:hypothetical protein
MEGVGNDPSSAFMAVAVVLILGLILRWVFKPSRPRTGLPVDAAASPDLGMLQVMASAVPRDEAMEMRAVLGDAGIRSSMSKRRDGRLDVLVFQDDADRARSLLGP